MSIASASRPTPPSPPEAWEPLLRFARAAGRPLERFLRIEAASSILLLTATVLALVWANSAWASSYQRLWHTPLGLRVGTFVFERPLQWFVNDGLMVVFFFVVGMEIRREVHHGELSQWRRAALPAAGALGGMVAPALLYLSIARGPQTHAGWGVPMATDIAFAVGVLALLGKRVPPALRVLLLSLAVIDDLGAIVVIALFYSTGIALSGLAVAVAAFASVFVLQRVGVRSKAVYAVPAFLAWWGVYGAGIHPTIAGVLLGLMTPVQAWLGAHGFLQGVRGHLDRLKDVDVAALPGHELAQTLESIDVARREAMSPAEGLIATLHPWVAFGVMPLFALANAGVVVSTDALDARALSVGLAVGVGLVVGKPIGILCASWLMLRTGLATLPTGITTRHLLVLGVVAGVGFTMALFVAQLAFTDATLLTAAKRGVLLASAGAGCVGLALGRWLLPARDVHGAATSADEAESSTVR